MTPPEIVEERIVGDIRVRSYTEGNASAKCLACSTAWTFETFDEALDFVAQAGCGCGR